MSVTGENARRARERIGMALGKYTLDRLLGVGGMAAVYSATHRNGNTVALKVLHAEYAEDTDIRGRFLREGYAANRVKHPCAVRVLDDDTTPDGLTFLVMELLHGMPLDAYWHQQGEKLDPREVSAIAFRLLDVLIVAHAAGIVHRDIKPENLFLTADGVLKILDFGIARLRDPEANTTVTRSGSACGTPAFMPPEQALGRTREIDARTDIYAVGATMFTLISGAHVHEAETLNEMVAYVATRPARKIHTVAPNVPDCVADVIDRALEFDRQARWPDVAAMQKALRAAHATAYGERIEDSRLVLPTVDIALGTSSTAETVLAQAETRRATATTAGMVSRTLSRRRLTNRSAYVLGSTAAAAMIVIGLTVASLAGKSSNKTAAAAVMSAPEQPVPLDVPRAAPTATIANPTPNTTSAAAATKTEPASTERTITRSASDSPARPGSTPKRTASPVSPQPPAALPTPKPASPQDAFEHR